MRVRPWLLYLFLVVVALGLVAAVLLPRFFPARQHPEPGPGAALRMLWHHCRVYQDLSRGAMPWDERGEDYALFRLKAVDRCAGYFDCPSEEGDVTGPARFDDEAQRVVGCDYEYLNRPLLEEDGDVVLFAEQWWVGQTHRHFITASGRSGRWLVPRPGDKTRLVGSRYDAQRREVILGATESEGPKLNSESPQ